MKNFEYKSVAINVDTSLSGKVRNFEGVENELNELGSQGWEVINFSVGDPWSGNGKSIFVIAKRGIE